MKDGVLELTLRKIEQARRVRGDFSGDSTAQECTKRRKSSGTGGAVMLLLQ
jgi:hypothetical protein